MASGKIEVHQEWCLIGELGLDGKLRRVDGALPIMIAKSSSMNTIIPFLILFQRAIS